MGEYGEAEEAEVASVPVIRVRETLILPFLECSGSQVMV